MATALMSRLPALVSGGIALAGAVYCLRRANDRKRQRLLEPPAEEKAPPPGQAYPANGFALVDAICDTDEFNELIRFLPAAASVRLSRCSRDINERVLHPTTATWCAESRRALLERKRRAGDLPLKSLGVQGVRWTLERLHLCEHPPRFPRIYFGFASDTIDAEGTRKLQRVAALLARHPSLRLCVHGFAQPNAPGPIGEALAQARATSVRERLLTMLTASGTTEFADEDPQEGVRADRTFSPWDGGGPRTTRLVGSKLQAVGRWRQQPRNRNFEQEGGDNDAANGGADDDEDDDYEEGGDNDVSAVPDEEDQGYDSDDDYSSKLRRAEFTLLGLDDASSSTEGGSP